MLEYVIVFVVLLIASAALYVLYDRFVRPAGPTVASLYVEALQDLLDGRAETAFTKLRQVVAEDSSNIEAYLWLGQILRDHKRPDRALQVHKDLTLRTDLTVTEKQSILKQLSRDYAALDDDDMAEAALKELTTTEPAERWAFDQLLQIQQRQSRWSEAYETAARILKIEANKSKKPLAVFKFQQGLQLSKQKEHHKARIVFKEALGLDPSYAAAYLAIGDSYCDEERFEDAVNFWTKLIEAVPTQGHRAIERLKKALFDLGRFGDIAQICEDILKHSPKDLKARLSLAEFHEKKGDMELAQELLTQIVEDEPDNLEAILELIRIYGERGDNKKLTEFLRQVQLKREKLRKGSPESIPEEVVAVTSQS
ncbi:MAG: tetratricopeptide repeat protein [candidate division Zixibacteria bacterium]|nr:tetratricopeptide repeat protein [candidate division Zixibacteria bacterium]